MTRLRPLALVTLLGASACEAKPHAPAGPASSASALKSSTVSTLPAPEAVPEAPPVCSADCTAALAAQPSSPAPGPAFQVGAAERRLGAAPKLVGDPIPVAQLLSAPEPYLGKTVKCEGKVARVCQAAGCWLELQPEGGREGLRVPMAGHAFFVPQDAVGQVAVVEGELRRSELPAAQKKHYEGEGMQAVGPLALEATSVVLRRSAPDGARAKN